MSSWFLSKPHRKAGKRVGIVRRLPPWLDYPLLSLKYLCLTFFLYAIFWKMNVREVEAFIHGPYNKIVDGKMLLFFLEPSRLTVQVMTVLILISLVARNFWCRYLCPYGALLGFFGMFSPAQVKRREDLCIDCRSCDRQCPGSIKISRKHTVWVPECIGCMECVEVCPQKDCLTLSLPKLKKTPPFALAAGVLTVFFLFWAIALYTGHWHTSISPKEARRLYPLSATLMHP